VTLSSRPVDEPCSCGVDDGEKIALIIKKTQLGKETFLSRVVTVLARERGGVLETLHVSSKIHSRDLAKPFP
jgi:hypothetical protein